MSKVVFSAYVLCQFFVICSCTIKQSPEKKSNGKTLPKTSLSEEDKEKNEVIKKVAINPEAVLDKTFYHVRNTDSGKVVVNYFQRGLNGIRYTKGKVKAFGFEEYVLNIDSINIQGDSLYMFLSNEYTNLFGEKEKDSHVDKIELINGKLGYILVNGVGVLIDSIYAGKTIPIVKEEPYDIKEAIGDY